MLRDFIQLQHFLYLKLGMESLKWSLKNLDSQNIKGAQKDKHLRH